MTLAASCNSRLTSSYNRLMDNNSIQLESIIQLYLPTSRTAVTSIPPPMVTPNCQVFEKQVFINISVYVAVSRCPVANGFAVPR